MQAAEGSAVADGGVSPEGTSCACRHSSEMPQNTQRRAQCLLSYQELRSSFMRRVLSVFPHLLAQTYSRTKQEVMLQSTV